MVVMIPLGSTFRIRLLSRSLMNRSPELSTATSYGSWSVAAVASPPSPENEPWSNPTGPLPATVEMMPVASMRRIRLLMWSATYSEPSEAAAMPSGQYSCAAVAGPPSPEKPGEPVPANVVIVPLGSMRAIDA